MRRSLNEKELLSIPSHYCQDCNTIFGYWHDNAFDEEEGAFCPYCDDDENTILVRDREDQVSCLMAYTQQLETKLEKLGNYSHGVPAGCEIC